MIKRYSKWLALLAAVVVLVLMLMLIGRQMQEQANRPAPVSEKSETAPDVSVVSASSGDYAADVSGFGAANARYNLTLTAQVAGRVATLADGFDSGHTVKKGSLLLQLEDSDYRAALAAAENDLASARVDLLEAQREADQARAEWQSSGLDGEPDSPLVLHGPQLKSAEAAVANAEAAVASARKDLTQTRITAPFAALIVSRSVAPGSYLQAGGEVAVLYSTDRIEVAIPLSQRDWANLPDISTLDQGNWPVTLTAVESGEQWQGYVLRAEQHLDDSSRQQSLIAAVDQPLAQTPALKPGTFVQASISGRVQSGLWRLPASALSQRGEIWYVDNGTLARFSSEPVASDSDVIFIRPPQNLAGQPVQVVSHPLNSYLSGMKVHPVERSTDVSQPETTYE